MVEQPPHRMKARSVSALLWSRLLPRPHEIEQEQL